MSRALTKKITECRGPALLSHKKNLSLRGFSYGIFFLWTMTSGPPSWGLKQNERGDAHRQNISMNFFYHFLRCQRPPLLATASIHLADHDNLLVLFFITPPKVWYNNSSKFSSRHGFATIFWTIPELMASRQMRPFI